MTPHIIWFGFHRRATLREAWKAREWSMFGHVEAWGEAEGVFFHFDPRAVGTILSLTTDADAFDDMFTRRIMTCQSVLRYRPVAAGIGIPIHPTMNCAAQCGHLVGLRAYSPRGLRRILTANGAVEIARNDPERRS